MGAAMLVPTIAGMLTSRPKMPNMQAAMPAMPDRSKYMNTMLDTSFNPNSEIYALAADQLGEQVRQQLALLGLTNSSMGNNMMINQQSELARKFIEDAARRQQAGLGMALGYDMDVAKMQMGLDGQNFDRSMMNYQMRDQEKRELIGGLGSAIGGGISYHQNQQMLDAVKANQARMTANFNNTFGIAPGGSQYGVPYTMPQIGDSAVRRGY
jgi:hypothetical protein